jgi:hypothetical protein
MRIHTTAWKAKNAFHTYAQGPAAIDILEMMENGTADQNELASSVAKGVLNLVPDRRSHWPVLK